MIFSLRVRLAGLLLEFAVALREMAERMLGLQSDTTIEVREETDVAKKTKKPSRVIDESKSKTFVQMRLVNITTQHGSFLRFATVEVTESGRLIKCDALPNVFDNPNEAAAAVHEMYQAVQMDTLDLLTNQLPN